MATPNEPEPVFRLIYSSHSLIDPDQTRTELGEIFATARRNNRAIGVTGALVVADDWFAQTLEGDESVVRALYEKIATDSRHDQVTLLKATNVEDRTFGRWAMARVSEDGGPDIRLLSNAKAGKIVEAGTDHHISPEQETVLAFMRGSATSAA